MEKLDTANMDNDFVNIFLRKRKNLESRGVEIGGFTTDFLKKILEHVYVVLGIIQLRQDFR